MPSAACWATLLAAGLLSTAVGAAPRTGETLPNLVAVDVTGQTRSLRGLIRGPTLVVAITDRDAADTMRDWFQAADRLAPDAGRISVVSIGVPFFVSDGFARARAREHIPPRWREEALLDTDHRMARELGLAEDALPWVFAVDGSGRVVATAHAMLADPASEPVWQALSSLARQERTAAPPRR